MDLMIVVLTGATGGVKRCLTSPTVSRHELRTCLCLIVKEEPFCKKYFQQCKFYLVDFCFLIDVYSQSCNQTKKGLCWASVYVEFVISV